MRALSACLLSLSLALPLPSGAQQSCTDDAMIVFDGSGSMAEIGVNMVGVAKISEARLALRRVLPSVAAARRLGLVIYGPGGDRTCRNSELRFGPQWEAAPRILSEVDALRPVGGTPLTEGVRMAAEALDYRNTAGAVVLVTDGAETCGGAPCALAAELAENAPGLVVHVIGFKVDMRGELDRGGRPIIAARCLADRTGGRYVTAQTLDELAGALRLTLGCNLFGALSPVAIPRPGG
ncbi:vWA domain-containing protein [Pseudoponticoccus marisrubri]|uniref:VWFA domain-containing protein n=1 Tax=Pseudoponticoccus marisrubri TaxID=1685382 RepID=A0A0W7WGQ5_9RHOB|nr:VWA domain-containing protein [Pseudoponticoccus marisrubri]KUF09804.1 hypothetical protein AVJ23_15250 [Pseudoponticoccus marisrubri]